MNSLWLKLIGLAGVATLAVGAWFYVRHLQDALEIEKANRAVVEEALKTTKNSVDNLSADIKVLQKITTDLGVEFAKTREDVKALDKKFTENKKGEQRNLENLAVKHPLLIEDAINKGTKEAARCNQLATGAKSLAGEKNGVCPSLVQ